MTRDQLIKAGAESFVVHFGKVTTKKGETISIFLDEISEDLPKLCVYVLDIMATNIHGKIISTIRSDALHNLCVAIGKLYVDTIKYKMSPDEFRNYAALSTEQALKEIDSIMAENTEKVA
jgi:hypothetical protein